MSFLFTNPMDDLVDKATSENLPRGEEDIALNLDICDKIRGKEAPPKAAISSLKRRINHKNPNVQLLALKLTDACVKNGGHHFLVEVASRDFVDNLVSIVRAYPGTNQQVRESIMALIQTWGLAFKGKADLSYMTETYEGMKREGMAFPTVERASAASIMIDTTTAPEWTDSDICTRCRTTFTTFNRKHHCRNCGQTYCHSCSSRNMALPHLGIAQEVRVCDSCHYKLSNKSPNGGGSPVHAPRGVSLTSSSSPPRAAAAADDDDDELERAIAASLAESAKSKPAQRQQSKSSSAAARSTPKPAPAPAARNDEEEDPDLAAAIAASLAELKVSEQQRTTTSSNYNSSSSSYGGSTQRAVALEVVAPPNPNELSRVEIDNLKMFVELVERTEQDVGVRGIGVIHNSQISALYAQLMALQPKLLWSRDDAIMKHRAALELNDRLTSATQMYDRLLSERLAAATGGVSHQRAYSATPAGQPAYQTGYEYQSQQQPVAAAGQPYPYPQPQTDYAAAPSGYPHPQQQQQQQQQQAYPPQTNSPPPGPPLQHPSYLPSGPDPYAPQQPQQQQPYPAGDQAAYPPHGYAPAPQPPSQQQQQFPPQQQQLPPPQPQQQQYYTYASAGGQPLPPQQQMYYDPNTPSQPPPPSSQPPQSSSAGGGQDGGGAGGFMAPPPAQAFGGYAPQGVGYGGMYAPQNLQQQQQPVPQQPESEALLIEL